MELGPFVADHDVCHGAEEREEEDDEEDEGDDDDEPPPLGDWWAEWEGGYGFGGTLLVAASGL
jgi:hypothetical protein